MKLFQINLDNILQGLKISELRWFCTHRRLIDTKILQVSTFFGFNLYWNDQNFLSLRRDERREFLETQ